MKKFANRTFFFENLSCATTEERLVSDVIIKSRQVKIVLLPRKRSEKLVLRKKEDRADEEKKNTYQRRNEAQLACVVKYIFE